MKKIHVPNYLFKLPASVPEGQVLVHNDVWPAARRPGTRGSRCWLQAPDPSLLISCDCGFASELGAHFLSPSPTG